MNGVPVPFRRFVIGNVSLTASPMGIAPVIGELLADSIGQMSDDVIAVTGCSIVAPPFRRVSYHVGFCEV